MVLFLIGAQIIAATNMRNADLAMAQGDAAARAISQEFHPDDEIVEIADGLYLGQLIYSTALDKPFHSSVDPAEYRYQLFGYFLLLDDAWQYHRLAIGLDTLS
ncbi:MAG: hypothetical protein EBU46_16570 [Nitrosomonadaceae bacterium]|nr:hypothetical protein [Nitrosomonadaceae bacterium]